MKKLICAVMLCGMFALPAQAAEGGFYAGVGVGQASLDAKRCKTPFYTADSGFPDADTGDVPGDYSTSRKCDDSGTGWKIFGGLNFTENFGLEGGYANLGTMDIKENASVGYDESNDPFQDDDAGRDTVDFRSETDASALYLAGILRYPFSERWSVFGKLGLHRWDVEGKSSADIETTVTSRTVSDDSSKDDDSGTDVFFGVGAQYDFPHGLGLRVEWERFSMDDEKVGIDSADLISGSLIYAF